MRRSSRAVRCSATASARTSRAPFVTLVDDPTNPKAYTATDVDGEGLAARRNVLIEDGVLRQFVHNSYSARRAGTVSTGNATRGGFAGTPGVGCLALSLVPGTRTQEELIADVDDGLLVQQMQGLHSGVNPISGDFSTGAAGLLIRTARSARRCGRSRSRRRCSGCCSTSSRSAATSNGCRCGRRA